MIRLWVVNAAPHHLARKRDVGDTNMGTNQTHASPRFRLSRPPDRAGTAS